MINYPLDVADTRTGRLAGFWSALASILSSVSFQLVSSLLIGCMAPAVLRYNFERFTEDLASYDNSLIGTMIATLIGFILFRKISVLPGTRMLVRVVPSFLIAFTMVLAVFFMARFDYSRYQFAASFVLVTVWFALIVLIVPRLQTRTIALVKSDRAIRFREISWINWISLSRPEELPRDRSIVLAADFSDPSLPRVWDAVLAREVLAGRTVINAKLLHESLSGRVQIKHLSENTLGHLSPDTVYAAAKHYVDIVIALAVLVFLMPVLAVIAILIRMDSPGPAIFRQTRIGYRGRPFTLYKFRTMRVQTETDRASDITRPDDDRITAFGRFLRVSRLDELPQIMNIMMGQMSWIGPRPEAERLSKWYADELPFYAYRHIVRPGISGWAQVQQGHVTSLNDVTEKLEYDFYYIKYFSIWIDLLITAKTLKIMLTGQGAK